MSKRPLRISWELQLLRLAALELIALFAGHPFIVVIAVAAWIFYAAKFILS